MWYDWVFAICPIVIAVRPLPSGLFYTCTLNKNAEARPPPPPLTTVTLYVHYYMH